MPASSCAVKELASAIAAAAQRNESVSPKNGEVSVYADASYMHADKVAGAGIVCASRRKLIRLSRRLVDGISTNTEAEAMCIAEAIALAASIQSSTGVTVYSDCHSAIAAAMGVPSALGEATLEALRSSWDLATEAGCRIRLHWCRGHCSPERMEKGHPDQFRACLNKAADKLARVATKLGPGEEVRNPKIA